MPQVDTVGADSQPAQRPPAERPADDAAGAGHRGYTTEPMFWGATFLGNMKNNHPVAAARVISVVDDMLDTLINNTGRVGR